MDLYRIYYKIVGYRSRMQHWSNSSVARWIRTLSNMEQKPQVATSEEWDQWKEQNKKSHPVVFWLTEEGLDNIQDIFYFPYDVYRNIRSYINNRFVTKSHLIQTNLKRGQWHESGKRILHGVMETVVQYVEGELAHMQDLASRFDEDIPYIKNRREAGLRYLDWEASLGSESPSQSRRAKEIKDVYLWWKDVYPNRPDPMDISGWSDYCEQNDYYLPKSDKTEEEREYIRNMLDNMFEIEQQYDNEENEMLIRVIKIRNDMWT